MPGQQPADLRSELATATRILASHQLIGMSGHVGVLTDDRSDTWSAREPGPARTGAG